MDNSGRPAERASSPDENSFNFIELIHSDLVVGDNKQATLDKVLKMLDDNDSLSLVFEWNPIGLKSFLEKVDKLPASATPAPSSFQGILRSVGDSRSRMLMACFLKALQEWSGCDVIDGKDGIVGVCGPPGELFLALGCMSTMDTRNDWLAEVLATQPPLEAPLAALHTPLKADGTTQQLKLRYQHIESLRIGSVFWDL
jgi:hypothetical protein